ncbi:MAG: S41 family peptidase [Defluviitaleaceae bacterium]|nr:S41 family peptidase [Defluviitaleaceae bacterium]
MGTENESIVKNERNKEKKTFLKGILLGAIMLVWTYTVVNGGIVLYRRHINENLPIYEKIEIIQSLLEQNYAGELNYQSIRDGIFRGMLEGVGDRYTSYLTVDEFERFLDQARGTFVGIGSSVAEAPDGGVLITFPFPNSPAYISGIVPGDIITHVDGADIRGNTLEMAISMITGEAGTIVTLTVYREDENRTFNVDVTRAVIEVPTVSYELLEDNIGYIRLTEFGEVSRSQFIEALDSLTEDGMESLIIDVRNNPGGRLDVVVHIAQRLVPEGLILFMNDANGRRTDFTSTPAHLGIPMVVLINGNSASASEVLAGAIQDHGVGTLIGEPSFGKASVQDFFVLPDRSAVRMTIATYYTPNGQAINNYGLTPDIVVEMDSAQSARLSTLELEEDIQLQKAISYLSSN